MKKQLISILYVFALASSANMFADDEEYNEANKPKQEEEGTPEGEVEEAKTYLNLSQNVDSFNPETIKNIIGRPFFERKLVPPNQLHPVVKEIVENLMQYLQSAGQQDGPPQGQGHGQMQEHSQGGGGY